MRTISDYQRKQVRIDDEDNTAMCHGCTDVFSLRDLEEYKGKLLCMKCFDLELDSEEEEEDGDAV